MHLKVEKFAESSGQAFTEGVKIKLMKIGYKIVCPSYLYIIL